MTSNRHTLIVGIFCVILFVLNFMDAGITVYAIEHLRYYYEVNPFMKWLLDISPIFFFITKIAIISGAIALLYNVRNIKPRMTKYSLIITVIIYGTVVGRSIYMLLS